MHQALVFLDGVGNLLLGALLIFFPARLVALLGLPATDNLFYPSLFGAVLVGIGVALFLEASPKSTRKTGLGLGGAVAINLCFGIGLAAWLALGALSIPLRGHIVLWLLAAVLLALSTIELLTHFHRPTNTQAAREGD